MTTRPIIPVILSGGSGSRLWPLSRRERPKQLLPLMGENTMIQDTVLRLQGEGFLDPVFICNAAHAEFISEQMAEINQAVSAIIAEPVGRNTASCGVISALQALEADKDALVLLLPADHHIADKTAFHQAIAQAAIAAEQGHIVTFGIQPTRAETGYGYIERGEALSGAGYKVTSFREKPDAETAAGYVESGKFYWNAGIFLYAPEVMLADMARHAPDVLSCARTAFEDRRQSDYLHYLDAESFGACPSISIDYAVMEKTRYAATVAADIGWSDIGSYEALHDISRDSENMSLSGDVILEGCENLFIRSDGPLICAVGVKNLAITVSDGKVLIVDLAQSQDVKKIVDRLKIDKRDIHL